ncbi:50S ribosomal protein L15 [bacterium]|nr:50S ribosomal protein L15 [bacterium]
MKLSELKRPEGANKERKRVGRGRGTGHGNTAGKGHKGQKARSGGKVSSWFEGGQMPLQRRIPKRGFHNPFRTAYQVVNLADISRLGQRESLTPDDMVELGLIVRNKGPVKVLAKGELAFAVTVSANAFSAKAREAIEAAGGKVEVL